jgi:hypothetical protein
LQNYGNLLRNYDCHPVYEHRTHHLLAATAYQPCIGVLFGISTEVKIYILNRRLGTENYLKSSLAPQIMSKWQVLLIIDLLNCKSNGSTNSHSGQIEIRITFQVSVSTDETQFEFITTH